MRKINEEQHSVNEIFELLKILDQSTFEEVEISTSKFRIKVRRGQCNPPLTQVSEPREIGIKAIIRSPLVGTCRKAPSLKIGDKVKKGQVLCVIAALNLETEILAEMEGTITAIYIKKNGQPVEYGEPLFEIATNEPPSKNNGHKSLADSRLITA